MKLRMIGLLVLATCLVGCVPSLHEFYTEDTVVYDPGLVGVWAIDDTTWQFDGDPNDQKYQILIKEKDGDEIKESRLIGHLISINSTWYLDLYPDNVKLNTGEWFNIHVLPAHTLVLLGAKDGLPTMAVMNPDTIDKIIEEHPDCVRHEQIEDRVVLTASPQELQDFVVANMATEDFFGDPVEMLFVAETAAP